MDPRPTPPVAAYEPSHQGETPVESVTAPPERAFDPSPSQAPAKPESAAKPLSGSKTPEKPAVEEVKPLPAPIVLERFFPQLSRIFERVQSGRLPGIPTGHPRVDREIGGLQPGLHLLAASPGAGKTTFCLQTAREAAKSGAAITYLALDEGGDRLAVKLLAGMSGLSATGFLRGEKDPEELRGPLERYWSTLGRIEIYSGPTISVAGAHDMIKARMDICGTQEGLLIVDFLQSWAGRMAASEGGKPDFRAAVTLLTSQLREVAMSLNIPVLAIVAQNRQGQNKASMGSLRESSDLEYMADSIFFLTDERIKGDDRGDAPDMAKALLSSDLCRAERWPVTLTCLKNRWGALFTVNMIMDGAYGRFWETQS